MAKISVSYQPNKIKKPTYTDWIEDEKFCTTDNPDGTTTPPSSGANLIDAFDVDWSAYKIDGKAVDAKTIIDKLSTPQQSVDLSNYCTTARADSLQQLIDGEVNTWFMEGEPASNHRPSKDWSGKEQRYEGDVYIDIIPLTINLGDRKDGQLKWFEIGGLNCAALRSGTFADSRQSDGSSIRTKCRLNTVSGAKIQFSTPVTGAVHYFHGSGDFDVEEWADNTQRFENTLEVVLLSSEWQQCFALSLDTNDLTLKITCDSEFTNPTAGQAWRWCNTDDGYGTGWHWHHIADSDAVKALAEAARALTLADTATQIATNKSKIFISNTNPTNYQAGDLWILPRPITLNEISYPFGSMLTASQTSTSFVSSHWSKVIRYTDDTTADRALARADAAHEALAELEIGGVNLLPNTRTGTGFVFQKISTACSGEFDSTNKWFKLTCPLTEGGELEVDSILLLSPAVELTPGMYTLSFLYRCTLPLNRMQAHYLPFMADGTMDTRVSGLTHYNEVESETAIPYFKKHTLTFYIPENCRDVYCWKMRVDLDHRDVHAEAQELYIKDIKLEKGDKATDWSPALEELPNTDGYLPLAGGTMTGTIDFDCEGSDIHSLLEANNQRIIEFDTTTSLNEVGIGIDTGLPVRVHKLIGQVEVITPKIKGSSGVELALGANTITSSGSITAPAFFESSDIRKKDIKSDISLDKCYDLIDKCQTIIYSLKSESTELMGMIAQEVEEFFPEVVATDADGFKSLAYDRLVVICFKVLKDVIKRLEKLEHE